MMYLYNVVDKQYINVRNIRVVYLRVPVFNSHLDVYKFSVMSLLQYP